jgi:DHA1 family tetracycline resistance protein-like MFS transporter
MGIGLVYPLFSKMLFDKNLAFLPFHTTPQVRGLFLGILFALMPLIQFFSSPTWGTISDNKGRKKPLQFSLSITIIGHIISILGIIFFSITLLLFSRFILGIGAGNISVVQASIADLSSIKDKAKNFGLYAMAIGLGFTIGPFLGGAFSLISFSTPFIFASILTTINLILAIYFLKETHHKLLNKKLSWNSGIKNLKKALHYKNIRAIFLCSFLCGFAWVYFMDFAPVYLIKRFNFSPANVGIFYGAIGGVYALSAGYLIRPFLSRFKSETLFWGGTLLTALCVLTIPFYTSIFLFIPFVIFFSYFSSFIGPTSTALVSNYASAEIQGEALGVLGSVNTASYVISALLAGFFVGINPLMSMWIGGSVFLLASFILLGVFRKKLFQLP